jgi:hypothetical protein
MLLLYDIAPLLGTFFYFYTCNFLKTKFINKENYNNSLIKSNTFYIFSILHNSALVVFSFYTFVSLTKVLLEQGIHAGHMIYMSQPHINSLVFWFYISKYYEYCDTFLLYCKGKKPIFLQKFHHVGAVICWHLAYKYNVDMLMFGSLLNSGVHSIMYFYYLLTIVKINVKMMRVYITIAQIIQLGLGGYYGLYRYYPPVETFWNYGIIIIFNGYITFLLYLFAEFAIVNYMSNKKIKTNENNKK